MKNTVFLSIKIFYNNTTQQQSDLHHRLRQRVMDLHFDFEPMRSSIWQENTVLVLKNIEFNEFFQVKKKVFIFYLENQFFYEKMIQT